MIFNSSKSRVTVTFDSASSLTIKKDAQLSKIVSNFKSLQIFRSVLLVFMENLNIANGYDVKVSRFITFQNDYIIWFMKQRNHVFYEHLNLTDVVF